MLPFFTILDAGADPIVAETLIVIGRSVGVSALMQITRIELSGGVKEALVRFVELAGVPVFLAGLELSIAMAMLRLPLLELRGFFQRHDGFQSQPLIRIDP